MSEPGSLQRTLAIPELCATSASMAWAMVPLADTDQPSATEAPFLVVLDPAGTVSSESTPGPCVRTGPVARSGTPTGGSAISATGPEPLPWTGGQARAAEVTATCRVTAAAESGPGAAGRTSCAAPAMTPSAASTAPAGTR